MEIPKLFFVGMIYFVFMAFNVIAGAYMLTTPLEQIKRDIKLKLLWWYGAAAIIVIVAACIVSVALFIIFALLRIGHV